MAFADFDPRDRAPRRSAAELDPYRVVCSLEEARAALTFLSKRYAKHPPNVHVMKAGGKGPRRHARRVERGIFLARGVTWIDVARVFTGYVFWLDGVKVAGSTYAGHLDNVLAIVREQQWVAGSLKSAAEGRRREMERERQRAAAERAAEAERLRLAKEEAERFKVSLPGRIKHQEGKVARLEAALATLPARIESEKRVLAGLRGALTKERKGADDGHAAG